MSDSLFTTEYGRNFAGRIGGLISGFSGNGYAEDAAHQMAIENMIAAQASQTMKGGNPALAASIQANGVADVGNLSNSLLVWARSRTYG